MPGSLKREEATPNHQAFSVCEGEALAHAGTHSRQIRAIDHLAKQQYLDEVTTRAECRAITDMNGLSEENPAYRWWQYTTAFENELKPEPFDFIVRFPKLQQAHDEGHFVGHHLPALEGLAHVNGHHAAIAGCPGEKIFSHYHA